MIVPLKFTYYVFLDRKGESCGLAVEHSTHDQKVVGSIPPNPMLGGSDVKAMPG